MNKLETLKLTLVKKTLRLFKKKLFKRNHSVVLREPRVFQVEKYSRAIPLISDFNGKYQITQSVIFDFFYKKSAIFNSVILS